MSCPVKHHSSDALDERNMMPSDLDKETNTAGDLSGVRVVSSIPRSSPDDQPGKDEAAKPSSWLYPSEQMFYNAMKRKGAEPKPEDMQLVVNIHNIVNEQCWVEILKWEKSHYTECQMPKLHRFLGRPDDLSPKAWFKHWILGYRKPFDRHDWYIDRCGTQVRYVIDFYGGNSDPKSPIAFHLDVRPAVDNLAALKDRILCLFSS